MVLAAGFGRRLRPLTDRQPKPLIRVCGRPLISYPLEVIRAAGIRDVIVNLHHRGDQIRTTLGDGSAYGVSITYLREDPILDTGGAIENARDLFGNERFAVLNSDTICDLDLGAMISWHERRGALATMVLRPDREAARYGLIEIDAGGRIRRFLGVPAAVEASLTPLMFGGVHVFEPAIFDYMEPGRFGINAVTYPRLLASGCPVFGYRFGGYWRSLDSHTAVAEARWELHRRANSFS